MEGQNIQFQDSTPTTDIYGTRLVERLSDIYFCIQNGAEQMEKQMCCGLQKPSPEGHMEIEILMAAILSREVEKGIVIQSLLAGNGAFNSVGLTNISEIMAEHLRSYRTHLLQDDIQERHSLMEFAKTNGKLVLKEYKEPDKYGNFKIPVFIRDGIETVRCRFWFFEKNEQTPDFIRDNRYSIVIDRYSDGEYLFKQQRDIDWWRDETLKYIAYDIYCSPLFHKSFLTSEERDNALGEIKRRTTNVILLKDTHSLSAEDLKKPSDICLLISYALQEGARSMEALASSLGIMGKFNKPKDEEDDLPF